ncbi:DUF1553 domain-containing protein [Pirellulales bacterium]|nr:DUF1553 domain-containing protein [Pirellulales bacterium]
MLRTVIACSVYCLLVGAALTLRAETEPRTAQPQTNVSFYRDVRPILQARCQGCHQPSKPNGTYVLTSVAAMRGAGDSEMPGVIPGKPDESYLVEQITPDDDGLAAMPAEGDPLKADEIETIVRWIEEGADDDTPESAKRSYDANHPPKYLRPPIVTSLDFSPDGSLLAIAGFHEVLLHDVSTAVANADENIEPVARLIGISERIASLEFSPDGTRLAATGGAPARLGEVQVWNVPARELELSIPVTFDTVYGASWSPDGRRLAFGCADNTVRAVDSTTGEQVLFQGAHSDWVLDTVFSTDGSHLASVARDATAKLIEVETERFVDNITSITPGALRGGINAVARHPQRDDILFGGADGVPKIYQMHRTTKREIGDDANLLWQLPALPGRIFSVDFSADGTLIAAGSSLNGAGAVHLYRMDPSPAIPEEIKKILVKPTHARGATEREELQQHFDDGVEVVATIPIDDGGIYAVAISADGKQVAAAGAAGMVYLIDADTGKLLRQFIPVPLTARNPSAIERSNEVADARENEAVDEVDESLPDNAEVVRLSVQPESIQFEGPTSYVQLVVSAELKSGDVVDVTRIVEFKSEAPIASVSSTGIVSPLRDGATTLEISLAGSTVMATVDAVDVAAPLEPDFVRDVAPILGRVGCNMGTCHGAQDGKNGFKLSLRGYDPLFDVRALADDLAGRRTDPAAPAKSLMLLKPTGSVPHEGGQVLAPDSDYYRTLLAWIEGGMELDVDTPRVMQIEVAPINPIVQTIGSRQQVRVVATYPDGRQRDVTREAFVESGDTEIARPVAGQPGLLEVVRRGEAPVLVRYEGAYAATTVTVMGDRTGFVWQDPPVNNEIDLLVQAKLQRTKTAPAPLCDDHTFLRRLRLDLTGLPPTPEQIRAFQSDPRDSQWKRNDLIDRLIGSDDYIEHWTNKWADMLQVNSKFLGRQGAEALRNWIRREVRENRPYDEFARAVLTAKGSTKENPAASYYKILREPELTMENTTHLFLATRFNCNKCHDHPFERWTQDQYYQMSAFFARVGLKKDPDGGDGKVPGTPVRAETPLYEVVFAKGEGEVMHLRTGKPTAPEFPFDCDYDCDEGATRRDKLAAWMTSPDNPYFAKSYANRVWAYLTGRGLIEPIDDIRAGNPPTNPELLDWLTEEFVDGGFDVQRLIRTICRSRTYQLSLRTNAFNEDDQLNYSHARARRLPAEVLFDAIYHTTGATSAFPGVSPGTRAAALPDVGIQLPDGFLNNLGRPARESSCECERTNQLQMGPIMALINGATVGQAVSDPEGAISKLAGSVADDRELLERLYLRILNRPARREELNDALQVINEIDEQHEQLAADLQKHEQEMRPEMERREQQRLEDVEEIRATLVAREQEAAPERARLAREREERIAAAKAKLAVVRTSLAEKLPEWEAARQNEVAWTPLSPIELSSTTGAELRAQPDQSVVVDGANGAKSTNQFVAPVDLTGITGVRLEALTRDALPGNGPGRAPDGNFVLTEFQLSASQPAPNGEPLIKARDLAEDDDGRKPGPDVTLTSFESVKLQNAKTDFSQDQFDVAEAIDGVADGNDNGWAIAPQMGKEHVAVFETGDEYNANGEGLLRAEMIHNYSSGTHNLGRFRISVTRSPRPLKIGVPHRIAEILAIAPADRTDEQAETVSIYYLKQKKEYADAKQQLAEAKKPLAPDEKAEEIKRQIATLEEPLPADPKLVRLRRALRLSKEQLTQKRLTAAQDFAWALINSPEFLYNH